MVSQRRYFLQFPSRTPAADTERLSTWERKVENLQKRQKARGLLYLVERRTQDLTFILLHKEETKAFEY